MAFETEKSQPRSAPLVKFISVASIAAGVQFGWALQLSLLTPYVQLLGIPHKWSSLIWLCGPISGMVVQPIVGYYSDRCSSRFGRRRPFIAGGALLVIVAVFLIGYSADFGHHFGDPLDATPKTRAIAIFALGFWFLDVANNMLQGPCRAFLADLAEDDPRRTRVANALFSFFMAVGNILGYSAGSYNNLHKVFPFTATIACDVYCANLKSCFFLSILLLLLVTTVALCYVQDKPWSPEGKSSDEVTEKKTVPVFGEIFGALKDLKKPMWMLLIVTAFNWIGWFPFLLFDTDWVGREVYGGDSAGTDASLNAYNAGVRTGALGLLINSVVLGFMSLSVEPIGKLVGGVKMLWGILNFVLAGGLGMTVLVTKLAESHRRSIPPVAGVTAIPPPTAGVRAGALSVFGVLGLPLAVTYSIPFALASIFSSTTGAGQGLSLGVLNLAIVAPQLLVSLGSGPFDAMFGGGNTPAFIVGAIASTISGVLAIVVLPSPPPDFVAAPVAGGFH